MDPPPKRPRLEGVGQDERSRLLSTPVSPPTKRRRPLARSVKSPWQLTWVRDLAEELNQDAVTLPDLLRDPLISECWEFNFLHDISFLMDAFDPDTRHLVKVHIVHGFWKRDDANRVALATQAAEYKNVELHVAPMPELFGTHHSKMMVLFRHDDTAEIIIHTANMISKDWTNMTNGVWKSPRLLAAREGLARVNVDYTGLPIGSGQRFKSDLINYLRSYDRRTVTCGPLADKLMGYDFCTVRAALVASVPGRHNVHDLSSTPFGWSGAKRYIQAVPCQEGNAEIVVQVSSIATLGAKDTWMEKVLFDSLAPSRSKHASRPKFKVVFPTPDEIRRSLDGYASGASIHTKIQSPQQIQQLRYLGPLFHHWANDCKDGIAPPPNVEGKDGGRDRAAPHIKTYVRYNDRQSIDWALLTSANLSKQAWGEAAKPTGETRIASWEIGVLVWPELFGKEYLMTMCFQSDDPGQAGPQGDEGKQLVGLRMPYSIPLQRYGPKEVPWVASTNHTEPDCHGQQWTNET